MSDANGDEPRAKRQKTDKFGRFAALKKLKDLKGSKHKYEVSDVENVYDTVDEKEYSKRVVEENEDWIVDDGTGYFEDGRDIFDDDLDSESIASSSKNKGSTSKKRKKGLSDHAGKGNLQYMISNMAGKPKKETANLEDDDVLSELISEISSDNPSTSKTFTPPAKTVKLKNTSGTSIFAEKQAAKDYMKSFSLQKKITPLKPVPLNPEPKEDDESVGVLKEIQNVDEVEEINAKVKTEIVTPEQENSKEAKKETQPVSKGPRKLFDIKVEEEPTKLEEEVEELNGDACLYFDDDFDMSQIDEQSISMSTSENDNSKIEQEIKTGWEDMTKDEENKIQQNIKCDTSQLPMITNEQGEEVLRFFWWDAYESPEKPGFVYLFGKIYNESLKTYASCCVVVQNIERKVYVLPRPFHLNERNEETDKPVTMMDVYHELNKEVFTKSKTEFKAKPVTKNYCFDPNIPAQSEYMEVKFNPTQYFLSDELTGKTFMKVFGTRSSFLELFLLSQKVKGPCWLDIVEPKLVTNPVTWCKYEIDCNSMTNINVTKSTKTLHPPPLVVASINFRTVLNSALQSEISMISCLAHTNYCVHKQAPNPPFQQHFCIITQPRNHTIPYKIHDALQNYKATVVQKMDSERALLNYFLMQFDKIDPDLVVGHDLQQYQINLLAERLQHFKTNNWSKLSKIKRTQMPKFRPDLFVGRLVCDLKTSARELIKSRSYDLGTLCQTVLKIDEDKRIEIEPEEVTRMFYSPQDLTKLISLTMQDTAFILKMMYELNVIPLALQITNIAGNVMSKTLLGGRSERNEFLLLHAFSEKDYIVPDKMFKKKVENQSTSARKKPTYSGGLVLDPKVGFYDKLILLMDFNSLYPSIIQEYNICFTTIPDVNNEENVVLPDSTSAPGILPTEIRKLVESRKGVKTLMKNPDLTPDLKMQYHIRQMALKLTANSMYGCLGFSNSRFYAKGLAALVTLKGREILTSTRDMVQKMSHDVIYGDTDSIMINTNCLDYEQVFKVGNKIKHEINKMYKQVELDIDGVFKYLLLLKKKKYAAVTLSKGKNGELKEEQEFKGLDIVRRDWSQLATEAGKFILNHLLSGLPTDERIENIFTHLGKLKEDLDNNRVPLSLLVITKQLTKHPKQYPDKNSQPHVQVALRHNEKGGKQFQAGDVVPYVICKDGTTNSAMQRAYHVDELKNSDNLKIDIQYYISQQIYPVITRLCEPIEEIDSYRIANTLGMDMAVVKKPQIEMNEIEQNIRKPEVMFKNTLPFTFKCDVCKAINSVSSPFVNNTPFLLKCGNAECTARPIDYLVSIQRQLTDCINEFISKFYANEMTCEDPCCNDDEERFISTWFVGKYPVCTVCEKSVMYRKYTEGDLYRQITFFDHIFDLSKADKKPLMENVIETGYFTLKKVVEPFLEHSAYRMVDFSQLFMFFIDEKNATAIKHKNIKREVNNDIPELSQVAFEPVSESEGEEDV